MSTGARPPAQPHRQGPSDPLGTVPSDPLSGPPGNPPTAQASPLVSDLPSNLRRTPAGDLPTGTVRLGGCHSLAGSASAAPRHQQDGHAAQRGSITVLMLAIIVAALLLAMALAAVGRASHAHAQAQGVADLAALAAARHLAEVAGPPCPVAQRVAIAHGAQVAHCRSDGLMVQVEVVVATRPMPGWHTTARAGARAGPVGLDSTG